jgi:hypothetical protein
MMKLYRMSTTAGNLHDLLSNLLFNQLNEICEYSAIEGKFSLRFVRTKQQYRF